MSVKPRDHHTEWKRRAACAHEPLDLFFPEHGTNDASTAKAICAGCPVRDDCLDYAVTHRINHGVWGGTAPKERRGLAGRLIA